MKHLFFIMMSMILIISACSKEEGEFSELNKKVNAKEPYAGTAHEIWVNILANNFGGYHKNRPNTRAEGRVSIHPYIEDGDTLLYIAQFEEGWEVYAAAGLTTIPILSSPDGYFNLTDPGMPPAMKEIINNNCEAIRNYRENVNKGIISTEEKFSPISSTTYSKISALSNGQRKTVAASDLPPGHWVLTDVETIVDEQKESPKLTKTIWTQHSPWNAYSKYEKNSSGVFQNCLAGCVAIAVSQYLYYTHFKDGTPRYTVSTATLNQSTMDYSFSGQSETIWNQMAINANISGTNFSALLIGWCGHSMNAEYGLKRTTIKESNMLNFINSVYTSYFYKSSMDCDYLFSSLDKGYPVLGSALSYNIADGTVLDQPAGHCFIIDYYKITNKEIRYTYGYERDPWIGEGADPWEDDDCDENGNIIGYAITREEITSYSTKEISMNWGWGSQYNSSTYDPEVGQWISGGYNWNSSHIIYKRNDIK
ncbi:MAG: C10 family peptidase [Muribaculaceae bacterium]|nr:C10 family peptidase [Muribaculaceae bacterium]